MRDPFNDQLTDAEAESWMHQAGVIILALLAVIVILIFRGRF